MGRYAFINNNFVVNVIVAEQPFIDSLSDSTSYVFCEFCGIGDSYIDGVFIHPKPFPSWVLNSNNEWKAPTAMPTDTVGPYYWDESLLKWVSRA